ncbi:MAG: virulence-associated E family protein [Bacillota bacterium]|nr:virulence-associated E family protein [Bacillota bacterium]
MITRLDAPQEGQTPRLKHDGPIRITVGLSRKDMHWRMRELPWSEFVAQQMTPTRTRETVAEYRKMSKSRQTEVKDVGGYVGGVLKGGRRKSTAVAWRTMLTLDLDFAPADFWDLFTLLFDAAALIYSTHSHTPDRPRLRLVVPTSRPVNIDEYGAVARRLAFEVGIDYFDDSTYEPERLMFNASCPSDGVFVAEVQDGPWLDPDALLATYDDWRDVTQWPESSRAAGVRQRTKDRQGDPLTKPGLLGAFNRAYPIERAIETFLPDVYTPTDIPNRYTYAEGSTAAGLIVYDDGIFAYSHHGTDPIGGQLVNAFDLVRIHLYGDLDEDAKPGTPPGRMPSYRRMLELIRGDDDSKRELAEEQQAKIAEDFGEALPDGDEKPDRDWTLRLERDNRGDIAQTIDNAVILMEHDPMLAGKIKHNTFAQRYEVTGPLPWREDLSVWGDEDDACLQHYLEKYWGYTTASKLETGVAVAMQRRRYHPVRDYLDSLEWDGTERLDTLLMDYLGTVDDNAYVRAVTRKTLVAAVKRIYEPGCKFDYVLTLQGSQGIGKSSILRRLVGGWLQETMPSMDGKEAAEQLRGAWIVELAELAAMRRSEIESTKSFITRTVDIYRVPYGRRLSEFPRQCIFVATTNEATFINDATGGRRWWVVRLSGHPRIKQGWTALDKSTVDQVWAEAVVRYKAGEAVWLDDKKVEDFAREEQRSARKESDKMGMVETYLDTLLPHDWEDMDLNQRRNFLQGDPLMARGTVRRDRVCVMEIWAECMGRPTSQIKRMDSDELHQIMSMLDGWERYTEGNGKLRFGPIYGAQRAYIRVAESPEDDKASATSATEGRSRRSRRSRPSDTPETSSGEDFELCVADVADSSNRVLEIRKIRK